MPSRVVVRPLQASDESAFLAAANRSFKLHRPWVKAPETPEEFAVQLERFSTPASRSFVIIERETGELAGVINVSEMVLGSFCSAYLGYYAFAGFERRGLIAEGVRAVSRLAFHELGLHRLEANIQPGNTASIALARACGFQLEGFSPRYLKIGGRWRDHERWALLAD